MFERFILPFPSLNSRQTNSTPRRTPQHKYIQITELKMLYKRKPCDSLVMQSLPITAVLPLHWKGQTIPREFSDAQHQSHNCSHWGIHNEPLASVLPPWSIRQKAKCSLKRMSNYLSTVINYSSNGNTVIHKSYTFNNIYYDLIKYWTKNYHLGICSTPTFINHQFLD